jgi:hypothetical protein
VKIIIPIVMTRGKPIIADIVNPNILKIVINP